MRGLGSENIDFRLRQSASRAPTGAARALARHADRVAVELQRVLVIGSFLRKDHPLFAARLRQAAKKGAKVTSVHALRDDWLMPMGPSIAAAPSAWAEALASIAAALAEAKGVAPHRSMRRQRRSEGDRRRRCRAASARPCCSATPPRSIRDAALLERLGRWIAEQTGATFG